VWVGEPRRGAQEDGYGLCPFAHPLNMSTSGESPVRYQAAGGGVVARCVAPRAWRVASVARVSMPLRFVAPDFTSPEEEGGVISMPPEMGPLYHWSPRSRLGGIKRLGLVPGKRNVDGPTYNDPDNPGAGEFRQPGVCFSPDPMTAWRYSHGTWKSEGVFDLWQVWAEPDDVVENRAVVDGRVVEVRIHNRVRKARLNWVGERCAC
jgi:hypothetical protein